MAIVGFSKSALASSRRFIFDRCFPQFDAPQFSAQIAERRTRQMDNMQLTVAPHFDPDTHYLSASPPTAAARQHGQRANLAENSAGAVTIDDLLIEVGHFEEQFSNVDIAGEVRVEDGRLHVAHHSIALDDCGYSRLCTAIGAPPRYVTRLPEPVRSQVLQHHFDAGDHFPSAATSRSARMVTRNDRFVGLSRTDLVQVGLGEVIKAIADQAHDMTDELMVYRRMLDDTVCRLELVCPPIAREVAVDDVILGGLSVSFSPVGDFATTIETFLHRLKCTNGMVHRECVGRRSLSRTRREPVTNPHARELHIDQIRQLTAGVLDGLQAHLKNVSDLRNESVTDVKGFLGKLLRQARLWSQNTMERLEEAWAAEEMEPTAYRAFNALTRVATHDAEVSARVRRSLSALAGLLAHSGTHICPHCFSVVAQ
jgi:hypothetical protein